MKSREEKLAELLERPGFRDWYEARPTFIQEMIKCYPYDKYKIIEGAPYGISCPGSTVYLESWSESGDVGVVVKHEEFLPQAIEHLRQLCAKHRERGGMPFAVASTQDHFVHVDPIWLEPYE